MKPFLLLFLLLSAIAQPKPTDPVEKTINLLKQNNWPELYKTFAPSVDVAVLGDSNILTKQQAESQANSFFSKNQPFAVKLVHKVESNPDLKFAVVILSCKSGNYRTSFSLRNNNGVFLVNELHIEAEKTN